MSSKQHKSVINEHVLAEWVDTEKSTTCVLGSCSAINRQTANFFMRVSLEPETGHTFIQLSLVVSIRDGTGSRRKEFLLVFLPRIFHQNHEFPLAFESLHITNLEKSSLSSVINQADLTNTGRIIRVRFDLTAKSCAILPAMKRKIIEPHTAAASNLISGFKSLSDKLSFNLYMRQSDYAIHGLRTLNGYLRNTSIGPFYLNLTEIYGRDASWIEWNNIVYKTRRQRDSSSERSTALLAPLRVSPPPSITAKQQVPPYSTGSSTSPIILRVSPPPIVTARQQLPSYLSLQVPQSSPCIRMGELLLQQTNEAVIAETPPGSPDFYRVISPTASLASERSIPNSEELENFGGLWNEIDPDENNLAMLHARESSLAKDASTVSETLVSEVKAWFAGAMMISDNPHRHQHLVSRLALLGFYARTLKVTALRETKIWCSTVLFYDPADSNTPELWTSQWVMLDMAELIRWSNTYYSSPEMCIPHIRCEFIKLGAAARAVTSKPKCENSLAEYKRQRGYCVGVVFIEFGAP